MAASVGRFYFVSEGKELSGHPLNGLAAAGAGPYVDCAAANKPRASAWDRRRIKLYVFQGKTVRTVTCADFADKPVEVKEWYPAPEFRTRFMLVPEVAQ